MKSFVAVCAIALVLLTLVPAQSEAKVERTPGGMPAFLVGCCFGIRVGTMWNEGAELHWREWSMLIPYWNIVLGIWNGMDCYNGITSQDWAKANGANWY